MDFAVSFITRCFESLFLMADRVFTSFDAYQYIYGCFFIFVVVKFLLIPIFGGSISAGSSDIAAKVRNKQKNKHNDDNA